MMPYHVRVVSRSMCLQFTKLFCNLCISRRGRQTSRIFVDVGCDVIVLGVVARRLRWPCAFVFLKHFPWHTRFTSWSKRGSATRATFMIGEERRTRCPRRETAAFFRRAGHGMDALLQLRMWYMFKSPGSPCVNFWTSRIRWTRPFLPFLALFVSGLDKLILTALLLILP